MVFQGQSSITKIYGPVESVETRKVLAVANVCGVRTQAAHTKNGDELKKAFLLFSPFGNYPVLDSAQGSIVGSTAVAIYIAQQNLNAKLLSGDSFQQSQCISAMEQCKIAMESDKQGYLAYLEVFLSSKSYLIGERLSVADVTTAIAVKAEEKSLELGPNVSRWLRTVMADNKVTKALKTQAASSPKKAEAAGTSVKGEEELPAQPTKSAIEIKDLPKLEGEFNMESWKRYYSNSADLKGDAMPYLFKEIQMPGHTFWKVNYIRAKNEGKEDYKTSNLMNGFIQRMPTDCRKFGFGVFHVVGEPGDYNYEGVLILRGDDMPAFMWEHVSFEYHSWSKMDVNKPADKAYIIDCFTADQGDKLGNKVINCCKQFS